MNRKRLATGIAIAGLLAAGAALFVDTAPLRAENVASDAQQATRRYIVGVTGMT